MWHGNKGPCGCVFCASGRSHWHLVDYDWEERGHLQVAESLDPADMVRTRICLLCAHEERI